MVPTGVSQSTRYNPLTCKVSAQTGLGSAAFKVDHKVAYDAFGHVWHVVVTVPGGGLISARQLVATTGAGSSAKPVTEKPLIESRNIVAKTAGKFTLTLRPTSLGSASLKANGSIKLRLHVTFDAGTGATSSSIFRLILVK